MNVTTHKPPAIQTFTGPRWAEIKYITCPVEARKFLKWAGEQEEFFSLDFETTGLFPNLEHPNDGPQIRTSNIGYAHNKAVVLDHFYCGSFASLAEDIAALGELFVFNVGFELRWFSAFYDGEKRLIDVGHMRRSVMGGGPLSLATQAKRDLKIDMEKEQQLSDWSLPSLSAAQIIYAGMDGVYTRDLGVHWVAEMTPAQWNGFEILNDAAASFSEMEDTGLELDVAHHAMLLRMWEMRVAASEAAIRKRVPTKHLQNIRSRKQVSDFIKSILDEASIASWPQTPKTKQLQCTRDILRQMSYRTPYPFSRFLAGLMVYNRAAAYVSNYGEILANKQHLEGRIRCRLNVGAAITGRSSASKPNLQSIPKAPLVRKAFTVRKGRLMVLADYSSVEVRVLAELSGDAQLLHDAIYDDIHARSAIAIFKFNTDAYLLKLAEKDTQAKAARGKAKG